MTFHDNQSGFMGGSEPTDNSLHYLPQLQPKPLTAPGRNRLMAHDDRGPVDPLYHPEVADVRRLRLSVAEQCALEGVFGDDETVDPIIVDEVLDPGEMLVIKNTFGAHLGYRLGEF